MELLKRIFKKKMKLTPGDLVLLTMLQFPDGARGEQNIHEFIYYLTALEEFNMYREELKFTDEVNYFSPVIHLAINNNCSDVSIVSPEGSSSGTSSALFSDSLKFDLYERVNAKEHEFSKQISSYEPKVFYISSSGRAVALEVLGKRLKESQKRALKALIQ
jgi:hypothetical protein